MRWLTVLFTLVATTSLAVPAPDLSWMSGDWRRCRDGEIVEERWLGPRGGLMIGANLTTSKSGKASWELLRLVQGDDGWTYWASPMGLPPVAFRMIEGEGQRAVFANPAHDFPTRIVYWREGEELLAKIEGMNRGKPAAIEWRFSRGSAEDCPKAP